MLRRIAKFTNCLTPSLLLLTTLFCTVFGADRQILTVPTQFSTLSEAIAAAIDGDAIQLEPGSYSGTGFVDLVVSGKGVSITGLGGADNTVLDFAEGTPGSYGLSYLDIDDVADMKIKGIRFTNSGVSMVGGIRVDGDTRFDIDSCEFIGLRALNGGALHVTGSMPSFPVWPMNSLFVNNSASEHGGAIYSDGRSVVVTHTVLAENSATRGGAYACFNGFSPSIQACTFWANSASDSGGAIYASSVTGFMSHTIIANSLSGGAVRTELSDEFGTTECDIFGNVGGDWTGILEEMYEFPGNISVDPLLCDPSSGDFTLCSDSPCLPVNGIVTQTIGAFGVGCSDCAQNVCGDADSSSDVDIDDAVYLISFIFSGGPSPDPILTGDANCSGDVDVDDVVYLIAYILGGGNPPCDPDGDGSPDC